MTNVNDSLNRISIEQFVLEAGFTPPIDSTVADPHIVELIQIWDSMRIRQHSIAADVMEALLDADDLLKTIYADYHTSERCNGIKAAIASMGSDVNDKNVADMPEPIEKQANCSEISYNWTDTEKDKLYDAIQEVIVRNDNELSFAGAFEGNELFDALKPFLRTAMPIGLSKKERCIADDRWAIDAFYEGYNKANADFKANGFSGLKPIIGGIRSLLDVCKPEPVSVSLEETAATLEPAFFGEAAYDWDHDYAAEMRTKARLKAKDILEAAGVKYVD